MRRDLKVSVRRFGSAVVSSPERSGFVIMTASAESRDSASRTSFSGSRTGRSGLCRPLIAEPCHPTALRSVRAEVVMHNKASTIVI
jgi:hypothetical protein